MHAHRRRTATALGFLALVFLVIGAASTIDRISAVDTLHAQTSWRGLVVTPEQRCSPYDADDYRYPQSVEDRIVAELGGVYGPYTGRWFASKSDTDIEHVVARSEAHDSGPVRRRPCDPSPLRDRPAERDAGGPARESVREGRPRRGRVAAGAESLLVRGPGDRGPTAIRAHHRPSRGRRAGPGAGGLRLDGVDHIRTWRGPGHDRTYDSRSRGDRRLGRQPERPRQLCGSSSARDRAGDARPSRVPVHAGWRRRRCGVRIRQPARNKSAGVTARVRSRVRTVPQLHRVAA